MRNILSRIGAAASIIAGAALVAQPAFATWQKCVTDGGYQDATSWGDCTIQKTQNSASSATYTASGNPCGFRQVQKGYYCADGGSGTICDLAPLTPAQVQRKDGTCRLYVTFPDGGVVTVVSSIKVDGIGSGPSPTIATVCDAGGWYDASEPATRGDCTTTTG